MRRAWPPVYRPPPSLQTAAVAAAVASQPLPVRYRRETVAAAGACFIIAAPCSCPSQPLSESQPRDHRRHLQLQPPPPLPTRNGRCPYRCCADAVVKPPPPSQQQRRQQSPPLYHQQQRRCAYVRPRPSRSLENLLRVVELDEATVAGHRGVYEKSCHYGGRRKLKASGKENRHAWKRRSMESLLSAREKAVEFHVSRDMIPSCSKMNSRSHHIFIFILMRVCVIK